MHRSICRDAPPTVGRYRGMDATSGQRGGCTVSATRRITTGRTISTQTKAVGMPATPEELREHRCLVFRYPVDGRLLPWGFVRDGIRFEAEMRPALVSDDIDALAAMAAAGGGIARLAAFVAAPWLARGELQVLFASGDGARTSPEPMRLFLCVSDRRDLTPKVRALMQHVVEGLPAAWRVDVA